MAHWYLGGIILLLIEWLPSYLIHVSSKLFAIHENLIFGCFLSSDFGMEKVGEKYGFFFVSNSGNPVDKKSAM